MTLPTFDTIPKPARHLILLLAPVILGWAGTDLVPALQHTNSTYAIVGAALLAKVVLWVTPLTRQYGVGSDDGSRF